ncbi:hypothetical protein [Desulfovibrio ferrophilus]|uniref:Uncharacterized protein n=1 Tax=Desulfovibrio ferrophilus TaxID=241368 RepID=A0A2Z6AZC2_9BACT|nr:hypothetical protein [Desulfovibrio ferrophilus]BBD08614.1 uncharacterized protein DFE_1888 [Desulfovibrio ferrophilus]
MPGPSQTAPMIKSMMENIESAREIAQEEIKALKKDLTTLERILAGRKKDTEFPLIDIAHSAFEIFRTSSLVLENERLLGEMQEAVDQALAEDFLTSNGATLLTEPEGWHYISPKGVMRFLGAPDETIAAATKIKRYLPKTPAAPKPKAESGD